MMIIATGTLTLLHPGPCSQGYWGIQLGLSTQGKDVIDLELLNCRDGPGPAVIVKVKEIQSAFTLNKLDIVRNIIGNKR